MDPPSPALRNPSGEAKFTNMGEIKEQTQRGNRVQILGQAQDLGGYRQE